MELSHILEAMIQPILTMNEGMHGYYVEVKGLQPLKNHQ